MSRLSIFHCPAIFCCCRNGADDYLKTVYGPLLVAPRDGSSVTLEIDTAATASLSDAARNELILKVGSLRRNAMAAPFLKAMAAVATGGLPAPMTVGSLCLGLFTYSDRDGPCSCDCTGKPSPCT